MSQSTGRDGRRGIQKAVTAFLGVATLISISSAAVRADGVTVYPARPSARVPWGVVRFLPIVDPVFGFPLLLHTRTVTGSNLTWGNYNDEPADAPADQYDPNDPNDPRNAY